jgi:hypothetical protein
VTRTPALTLRRPWTACFTDIPGPAAKTVENRSWVTRYRGDVYLHAGQRFDSNAVDLANRIWASSSSCWTPAEGVRFHLATDEPVLTADPKAYPAGVVAVAELYDICQAGLATFGSFNPCECGPWAFPGQAHWKFRNVRKLREAVYCRGAQQLWALPADVEEIVRKQMPAVTS